MAYIGVSPSNGVRKKHTYTATANQTSFSGAGAEGISLSYLDSNYVDVYQNGVKLSEADYTSTTGTTVVLATGATVSDMIEIIVYDVFSVADTVSASDGGTFTGAVTFSGGVSGVGFPSDTSMLFQQTSAPTGWTKQTTHNDKSLRLVSGSVGTGGSVAFSSAMATPTSNLAVGAGNLAVSMSGNISNTTLSIAQMPTHTHNAHTKTTGEINTSGYNGGNNGNRGSNINGASLNEGGGGAHNHAHNLSGSMSGDPALTGNVTAGNLAVASTINVQYVDFIIANKD